MRSSLLAAALSAIASNNALNILLSNDDGFGSARLVQLKKMLAADGHKTAPADNESGQGGRAVYTTSRNLTVASEFNIVPAGAPSLARSPFDPDIWYYNGTPAACTFVALDYVIPNYYNNMTIDLYTGGQSCQDPNLP
jgi:5'-nucleotidase